DSQPHVVFVSNPAPPGADIDLEVTSIDRLLKSDPSNGSGSDKVTVKITNRSTFTYDPALGRQLTFTILRKPNPLPSVPPSTLPKLEPGQSLDIPVLNADFPPDTTFEARISPHTTDHNRSNDSLPVKLDG